jgi:hypothetical protein
VPELATHENFSCQPTLQGSSDRFFGFLLAVFFVALGVWPLIRRGNSSIGNGRLFALAIGAAFGLLAAFRPAWLGPLNAIWTRVGLVLGRVVNPVVLALLFYAVVTPCAVILRWMGQDFLKLRYEQDLPSYWIPRVPPGPPPETMANQF